MKRIRSILSFVLVAALLLCAVPLIGGGATASAFTPAHEVIRIGINAPSSWRVTPSVTLSNTSGLRIGGYNDARHFVPSNNATHNSLTITANGNTVVIRNAAGETLHSGGTIAVAPANAAQLTTYTLPNASYGGNLRTTFQFFGGFRFSAAGGNLTVVNYIDVEDYLKGVVPYEMPASWPLDALKAQAVTARTFAVANFGRFGSHGFDLTNTTVTQVYRGMGGSANANTNRAVTETRGQVILHNGSPIDASYHSTSGGATEDAANVWGGQCPVRVGRIDPHSTLESVQWTRTLTPEEFRTHMRSRDSAFNLPDIANVTTELTPMGNIFSVTFTAENGQTRTYSRGAARNMVATGLHQTFNSQRFTITRNPALAAASGEIAPLDAATLAEYIT
ncbi:MAG: SpoIID/LytB domain-containing protein, partial [Oscillospiraceae bacterium]|nr:SpoIID/LytB domain-containing protein [Oscillospiraceae bacterium]